LDDVLVCIVTNQIHNLVLMHAFLSKSRLKNIYKPRDATANAMYPATTNDVWLTDHWTTDADAAATAAAAGVQDAMSHNDYHTDRSLLTADLLSDQSTDQ
jgi:hypothetical protein